MIPLEKKCYYNTKYLLSNIIDFMNYTCIIISLNGGYFSLKSSGRNSNKKSCAHTHVLFTSKYALGSLQCITLHTPYMCSHCKRSNPSSRNGESIQSNFNTDFYNTIYLHLKVSSE